MTKANVVLAQKLKRIGVVCMVLLSLSAAAPPSSSWSQAALRDLVAMHNVIRDNHPGPIDPRNPGFRSWLDSGEETLLAEARSAGSLHDYQLVLRDYANGFADGHLSVGMKDAERHVWPGFLVRADAPGEPLIVSTTEVGPTAPANIHIGLVVKSCGGYPARQLLKERVLRPALNPHGPQRLRLASAGLMVANADAPRDQWPSCVVSDGQDHTVALHWHAISEPALAQEQVRSSGIERPPTQVRQIGDVWLISMPTFYAKDADVTTQLQTLVTQVRAQAGAIRAARHVVLDLRGNTGGDDDWGFEVAAALWGKQAVDAVEGTMPSAIDWRVSARNLAALHADSAKLNAQGQASSGAYFGALATHMAAALKDHELFLREAGDPAGPAPHLVSPFQHTAFVLTTPHCASACLDFVDLLNGLPGTKRVGLETSSDTDYLKLAEAELPSEHATLRYAMKVYRQRERGANVSYKPTIAWNGGAMDDMSIVRWIDKLE